VRWSIVVLVTIVVAAVIVVGASALWSDRAKDICRDEAPKSRGDYSVAWDWNEFAYVCDYGAPEQQPKRVEIIDAFHGEGSRRHR
jgi:hypothetical protein